MKKLGLLLGLIISLTTIGQNTVQEKIKKLNLEMEQSFNADDMLKTASFYLDSALISAGGRMNVTGRAAIDEYWTSLKGQGASWKLEIDSIDDFGMYVLQRGRSYLKLKGSNGAPMESNVRFFIVWKKVGDSYKIESDIYTRL